MPIEQTPNVPVPDLFDEHSRFLLAAIVESSFDAIVSKDLNSVIRSWNAAAERMFGYPAEEAIGKSVTMLIPENLQSEEVDIINRIKSGERVESFETVRLRRDGSTINVSLTISPIRNAQGTIIGASKIARDITQAKEAERRIRLLLREVNHRVKNQFAVILSIIRETSDRAAGPEEFQAQLRDRIMALSRSHDLLVNSDWSGASLLELIHHHVGVFGHEQLVTISGPLVTLNSNAVQHLGMAIHELGTNSAKYGVLAQGLGAISIDWKIGEDEDGNRILDLVWREELLETVAARLESPSRRGFGSVVVERVVPLALSGKATLERQPKRVIWSLRARLDALTQPD
ncbi:PAS domain S-box protein [Devosia sp. Root685]|uniref:PAS domain S-box protein n=1 Tax=Devosia sp. Root685 TaxID=1736587 RepID=UPI0009EAC864|nr:PAS domain S-box protein [Devosia sp. Root685]